MLSALTDFADPKLPSHARRWLFVLGAVILAQLAGLWMLCHHQVQLAQARHEDRGIRQVALADCVRYIPGATIGACQMRLSPEASDEPPSNNGLAAATVTRSMGAAPAPTGGSFPVTFSR